MFKKYVEILGWLLVEAAALGNITLGVRGVVIQNENWLFKLILIFHGPDGRVGI